MNIYMCARSYDISGIIDLKYNGILNFISF